MLNCDYSVEDFWSLEVPYILTDRSISQKGNPILRSKIKKICYDLQISPQQNFRRLQIFKNCIFMSDVHWNCVKRRLFFSPHLLSPSSLQAKGQWREIFVVHSVKVLDGRLPSGEETANSRYPAKVCLNVMPTPKPCLSRPVHWW